MSSPSARYIHELELSRNVDNYFSQAEQAAFCTSHIVLGIDFSNDPLLPSHNFSYFDTQTCRLSINWEELSIRRPVRSVLNNQDGTIRHTIHKGTVNYWPNRLEANPPAPPAPPVPPTTQGGFISYPEKESDIKAHMLSAKSKERLFQARLFYNSRSPMEKTHPTHAYSFELDHCDNSIGYNGMAERLAGIGLGARAGGCGEDWSAHPKKQLRANPGRKANGLSQLEYMPEKPTIKSRHTVILIADSYDPVSYEGVKATVKAQGALPFAIAPKRQRIEASSGNDKAYASITWLRECMCVVQEIIPSISCPLPATVFIGVPGSIGGSWPEKIHIRYLMRSLRKKRASVTTSAIAALEFGIYHLKPVSAESKTATQVQTTPAMAIPSREACASESSSPNPDSNAPAIPKSRAKSVRQAFWQNPSWRAIALCGNALASCRNDDDDADGRMSRMLFRPTLKCSVTYRGPDIDQAQATIVDGG